MTILSKRKELCDEEIKNKDEDFFVDDEIVKLLQVKLEEARKDAKDENKHCPESNCNSEASGGNDGSSEGNDGDMFVSLEEIHKIFKDCEKSYKKFMKIFPKWREKRENVIKNLEEIAKALDGTKFNCNVARLTASSVGVAGGIATIAGAILIPFTLGLSTPLMIGGIATSVVGGTTGAGTSITEMVILNNRVKESQQLLKEDQEAFKCMIEWFESSQALAKAINKLLDFKIFHKMMNDLQEVLFLFSFSTQTHPNCRAWFPNIAILGSIPGLSFLISVFCNPILYIPFFKIVTMHKKNPVIFEVAGLTAKVILAKNIAEVAELSAEVAGLSANCGIGAANLSARAAVEVASEAVSPVGKAISAGIFAGLGLAFDVTSIVLTSIDVHNGSKCPQSEDIINACDELKEQLSDIENVYREMKKYQCDS